MKNTTTRRPRRCRCEYCGTLYLPSEESGLYRVCGRCLSLWLRLHDLYRSHDVDVEAKIRAILADPLGQETRDVLAREALFSAIEEADGYELALIEQRAARIKKAAMRERFSVIQGGRES